MPDVLYDMESKAHKLGFLLVTVFVLCTQALYQCQEWKLLPRGVYVPLCYLEKAEPLWFSSLYLAH